MDRFERGVKEVIAINSRYNFEEINVTDPLDRFISSFWADRLAREIKRRFRKMDTTLLTNKLYTEIKKVSQLIDFIKSAYS